MRALCGAIITAGAMIGLGLTALGYGTRYAQGPYGTTMQLPWSELDKPLVFTLVFLACVAIIGLGIAFLGLAYHHHRRHHEFLREHGHLPGQAPGQTRTTV